MALDVSMACRSVLMALVMVWLYAAQSMGQTTPGTILTRAYFNKFLANLPASCSGNGFYTYDGIIRAAQLSKGFGTTGSVTDRKREVAAFLANVMHETGGLCYVRELSPPRCYCTQSRTYPCARGKCYYGRGPLQLTWNYNYGAAGKAIGQDLLNHPELVSTNPTISFQTAFWFWMTNCHGRLTNGGGFASTIRCINGGECRINRKAVNARVAYYRRFCADFNVTPGPNISC
eukprot:TRINITY_DN8461_c0_g1_i1.p1 TRINITY_DN8461_c0_g1~~TRINITY_DN8461_c0_g1_i1.p1  ORF type:complete len:232 (-),score=17.92 TRINITY_DN8461_c0_g1_i1:424-1119(-)